MLTNVLFFKAFLAGVSIAAPIGPIAILCIRHNIYNGLAYGLMVGLGASAADAVLAGLVGFGVNTIQDFLVGPGCILKYIGSLYIAYLGFKYLFINQKTSQTLQNVKQDSKKKIFIDTFLLCFVSPMTIMLFVGMFSSLGVNCSEEFQALTIIAGVTLGSGLWWLFVSLFLRKTRNYLSANAINRINHLSGVILIGFAAWAILPDLWNYLYPVAGCGCGS